MTLPKAFNNLFYLLNKQLAILIIKFEKILGGLTQGLDIGS